MRPARNHYGFRRSLPIFPFERFDLQTTQNIKDDIFSSIEFVSGIEDVGLSFLKNVGITKETKKNFLQFQALIKQGRAFYESAETLHYRASSLNYYYSFLNLAKAYITTISPQKVRGKAYHGLQHLDRSGQFSQQAIKVKNGVFPIFYEAMTGAPIPINTTLKIPDLLGFCSDVSVEYEQGGFGKPRPCRCNFVICKEDKGTDKWYVLLAIAHFDHLAGFKKSLAKFNDIFEAVELSPNSSRETFGIYAEEKGAYTFFESKKTYSIKPTDKLDLMNPMLADLLSAIHGLMELNPYRGDADFSLVPPLRKNLQLPMREILAIYVVMFYLGSLVRYNPAYLEKMLASREAWLIEQFAKSAPTTFLRKMRNLILRQNVTYSQR